MNSEREIKKKKYERIQNKWRWTSPDDAVPKKERKNWDFWFDWSIRWFYCFRWASIDFIKISTPRMLHIYVLNDPVRE